MTLTFSKPPKKICSRCGKRNELLSLRCQACLYSFHLRQLLWTAVFVLGFFSAAFILFVMLGGT